MATALEIRPGLVIPAADLSWRAVRSGGPGGQNVNKVASKVVLRFDLAKSNALDLATRQRLRVLAASRLDSEGALVIQSEKTRDQPRNLDDARERLRELILRALVKPVQRKATKPSRGARERRLEAKHHQSTRKRERSSGSRDD